MLSIGDYLETYFVPVDNIRQDKEMQYDFIKSKLASMLIEAFSNSDQFESFVKDSGSKKNGHWIFPLKNPIMISQQPQTDKVEYKFDKFTLFRGKIPEPDKFGQKGRARLVIKEPYHRNIKGKYWGTCEDFRYLKLDNGSCVVDLEDAIREAIAEFSKISWLSLFSDLTPYNTPDKICRYWKCELPLTKLPRGFELDYFHNSDKESQLLDDYKKGRLEWSEEYLINHLLECLVIQHLDFEPNLAFEKTYGGWHRPVFSFKNKHGENDFKLLKIYQPDEQVKVFIPAISHTVAHERKNQTRFLPLPVKNQRLLGLENGPQVGCSIILTDSPELAAINNNRCPKELSWVSFFSDCYDDVDWSPLENFEGDVFLLITNHSGKNLVESYEEAHELASAIKDRVHLKYIQVEVDYQDRNFYFNSVSDIINHRQKCSPKILDDSIIQMDSFDEFEKMYEKAIASLNLRPFYLPPKSGEEDKIEESEEDSSVFYYMRPHCGFATVGGKSTGFLSQIHSLSGVGKSAYAYSYCASIVAGKSFLPEKWWCQTKNETDRIFKVLYFNFELSEAQSKERRKKLIDPYFIGKKEEKQRYHENILIEDLKDDPIDCTKKINHQKVFDYIEKAKSKGDGQPVNVVVFDTYTKMLAGGVDTPDSWAKIHPMIRSIQSMGISVIVIHHSARSGEPRGFISKCDDFDSIVKLSRKDERAQTWEEPMKIEISKGRNDAIKLDLEPFEIKLIGHKWEVHNPAYSKIEAFGSIVKDYRKDWSDKRIRVTMGLGRSRFYELWKEYKEKSK